MLPRSSYAELFRVTEALVDLLRRTVLEVGQSTPQRMAAFGASEQDYPLFLSDQQLEERYAACLARPDVIVGPTGLQFLEFNISGGFAGVVEGYCRYEAWRKLYLAAERQLPFKYHDPFASRADFFSEVCQELALPPRLAWVGVLRESVLPTDETRYFDLETDFLRERGFEARYFEVADADQLWDCAPEDRFDLGLRHFNVAAMPELGVELGPVRRALDNGSLLLSTQTSGFLANKLAMGLLSEGRDWMSSAERALVNTYIPWTRVLTDRSTTFDGRTVDLLRHVLANQEQLVLKRGIGSNGKQVAIGRDTDPSTWTALVESAAAAGDSVVQQYVTAQSCLFPVLADSNSQPELTPIAPVLSPFLFGRKPAGIFARFFADGSSGIVSVVGHSASDNVVVTR
ncbi:MAG: hypothetical protein ABI140_09180 [Jatrophihabitantaceae bacterium]